MTDRYYLLDVTVPPGTAASAPLATPWPLEDGTLAWVEIRVPDGHSGLTGIRFRWSTQVVIPTVGPLFIVANGEVVSVPWNGPINAGALTVEAFNTDVWPHTFYLRASVSDSAAVPQVSVPGDQGQAAAADAAAADVAQLAGEVVPPPPADVAPDEPSLPVDEADLEDVIT